MPYFPYHVSVVPHAEDEDDVQCLWPTLCLLTKQIEMPHNFIQFTKELYSSFVCEPRVNEAMYVEWYVLKCKHTFKQDAVLIPWSTRDRRPPGTSVSIVPARHWWMSGQLHRTASGAEHSGSSAVQILPVPSWASSLLIGRRCPAVSPNCCYFSEPETICQEWDFVSYCV